MAYSQFHHLYRIDALTFQHAGGMPGLQRLQLSPQLPESARSLVVDPAVFTHAYMLLGENTQRFGADLSLYLATVQTFFRAANTNGGLSLAFLPNPDSKRRLSEDLGVAFSSLFMVDLFDVTWESVSQIPHNPKLSKKRPDFQGFCPNRIRYLFEAKGTTKLAAIEPYLTKAMKQVKGYPEPSKAKFAIVTYFSADERLFPSMSFVVDPPGLPEGMPPDYETSRLLHFEKVLEFAGLPTLAKAYVAALSEKLRGELSADQSEHAKNKRQARMAERQKHIEIGLDVELKAKGGNWHKIHGAEVLRQELNELSTGIAVTWGVALDAIRQGIRFGSSNAVFKTSVAATSDNITSVFTDGTFVQVRIPM